MTQKEAVLATIKHKPVEFIPGFCFFFNPSGRGNAAYK